MTMSTGTNVLTIRRYLPQDRESIEALHVLALQRVGAYVGNGPWDDDLRNVQAVYLNNGGEFLVGMCAGEIVAMGGLRRINDERAEIKRLRVHPDYQRRGFGQRMMDMLEDRARRLGYRVLFLDTTTAQTGALNLIRKNGYQEIGRRPFQGMEMVLFEKALV